MKIPEILQLALEKEIEGYKINDLRYISDEISRKYLLKKSDGSRLIISKEEALTYALVRMPATYAAVYSSLHYALDLINSTDIHSMLDVGAGTGAAVWAAEKLLDLKQIDCLEREFVMAKLGEKLLSVNQSNAVINWLNQDITEFIPKQNYDIIIASYALNELSEIDRNTVLSKLWQHTNMLLLIVESGTPFAYNIHKKIRAQLKNLNAQLIAPCPEEAKCQLLSDDWCHFICRVERSKLHKLIKNAESPYEDEKYTYSAFFKLKPSRKCLERIIRRPIISTKQIAFQTCSKNGINAKIFRKTDGEIYKKSKKLYAGDALKTENIDID